MARVMFLTVSMKSLFNKEVVPYLYILYTVYDWFLFITKNQQSYRIMNDSK